MKLEKLRQKGRRYYNQELEDGEMKVRQENVEPMRDDLGDAIKEVKSMIAERAAEQAGGGN